MKRERKAQWERTLEEHRAQFQPFEGKPPNLERLHAVFLALIHSENLSAEDRQFLQHLVMQAIISDSHATKRSKSGRPGAWATWMAAGVVRELKGRYKGIGVTPDDVARAVVGAAPGVELTDDEIADADKISRAYRKFGKTSFTVIVFDDHPLLVQAAARLEKTIEAKRKQ